MRTYQAPLYKAVVAVAVLIATLSPPASAFDGVTLTAQAGIGGLVRPGRWTIVQINLANQGADLTGMVIIDAGGFRVVRAMALPAPSNKRVELPIRIADADVDHVRVSYVSHGLEVRSADVPIRLVPDDAAFVVCAMSSPGAMTDQRCTVSVDRASLPRSWRGYDGVDQVLHANVQLESDQVRALERWDAWRAHEAVTAPAIRIPAVPPSPGLARLRVIVTAYAALITLLWAAAPRLGRRPAASYAALGFLLILGCVAADGRMLGDSPIALSDAVVLRANEGLPGAFLSMHGTAEFPSFHVFELRPTFDDGILHLAREETTLWFGEDGVSHISRRFGRSRRQAVEVEGFSGLRTLEVARSTSGLRIANVSPVDFRDCELPPGLEPRAVAVLAAGASMDFRGGAAIGVSAITCRVGSGILSLASPGLEIEHDGTAVLIYALRS